jgi:hypothetical protein
MTVQVRKDAWSDDRQYDQIADIAHQMEELQALVIQMKTLGTPYKLVLGNYANDAAAAVGGILVGQLYRNGSIVQVRVA